MAKAQTLATKKYEASKGIIAKSFKMKRDLAERFKQACSDAGVSQTSQIAVLLENFISEVEKTTHNSTQRHI